MFNTNKIFNIRRFIAYLLLCVLLASSVVSAVPSQVVYAAQKPVISKTSRNILIGETYNLDIKNKVKNSTYEWKSSDTSIAKVNERGIVTGVKKGTANITCLITTPSRTYELLSEVVIRNEASSITINNKVDELTVGRKYNLNKTIKPSSSNDKTTWISSDETIAKPDKNGIFTALKVGEVTITAKTLSGKTDKVIIKVREPIERIVSELDVIDGVVKITDASYDIVVISNSVDDAEIILENVTITDKLELEQNAAYTVRTKNSNINSVVALEEAVITAFSLDKNTTQSPTFIAEEGTLIVNIDARGNVSIKQVGKAEIGVIKISRKIDGNIDVNLDGFSGNLVVKTSSHANIAITTTNCNIPEATISGSNIGQNLSVTDNTSKGQSSNIGKINVNTSAALSIDVPVKNLVILDTAKNASITVEKPIENILNNGNSTKLNLNSNVSIVISNGDMLNMKVAAGSTVKTVEAQGNSTIIDVALGSAIDSVVSKGNASEIKGNGTVKEVTVQGNDNKINTPNTTIIVGDNASGTTAGGKAIESGTKTTPAPTTVPTEAPTGAPSTPVPTGTPTSTPTPIPGIPETGTVIKIQNPGIVWAGSEVQLTADMNDISWSVYSFIDSTGGYAIIDSNTGVLKPERTGNVRVVAASIHNNKVYGAVDIAIEGKKFVRIEPLDTVVINGDEGLIGINELRNSGKLPTLVNVTYETGNGEELETITVDMIPYSWYGTYSGDMLSKYALKGYINVPSGYERPADLYASVIVEVNSIQTDNRVTISQVLPLAPITLTEDNHIINIPNVFNKYLNNKNVEMILSDGSTIQVPIRGYYGESVFNGAVPDTYTIYLSVEIPVGVLNRAETLSSYGVSWYDGDYLPIQLQLIVQQVQTPSTYEPTIVPDTTQPRFTNIKEEVTIHSVTLQNTPNIVYAGDIINLSDYVVVDSDSSKLSNQRVYWTVNGTNYGSDLNIITGLVKLGRGSHLVRVTSAIDNTKFSEVKIQVEARNSITEFVSLTDIFIEEDLQITDFTTLYKAIKNKLPRTLTAIDKDKKSITVPINGWNVISTSDNMYVLEANFYNFNTHNIIGTYPQLSINLINQTDARTRVNVVTGSAIELIPISTDQYATSEPYLFNVIYKNNTTILVPVLLEDNLTEVMVPCTLVSFKYNSAYYNETGHRYNGDSGKVLIGLKLMLPDGYILPNGMSEFVHVVGINVEVPQTLRYESLWVSEKPSKLSYQVGEIIDLGGIQLAISNSQDPEVDDYTYIGADKLAEYGIELRIQTSDGRTYLIDGPLSIELNGAYVYLRNNNSWGETFFGPITVTE